VLSSTSLVITAWKRPAYLAQSLQSWAAVPELRGLNYVLVALGWSHVYDDQVAVIRAREAMMGRPVSVMQDSPDAADSPGMHRALGEAIDAAFTVSGTEWVLCSEEDVVVSTDVLAYTGWAQQHYADDVLCICAHNRGGMGWDNLAAGPRDGQASQTDVRRLPYFNPWGWCISRRKWETVARPVWDWDCNEGGDLDSGYDWGMQRLSSFGPWVNLVPDAARSQTIGRDGGVYSTPDIFALQQARSFREHREHVSYQLLEDE
jgi:hypothetical protein